MNNIEKSNIENKIRLIENTLNVDPNNQKAINELNYYKKQLENLDKKDDDVVVLEDDFNEEKPKEEIKEELKEDIEENSKEDFKEEVVEKPKKKSTKKIKKQIKSEKNLFCKGASVRNIPQPLMNSVRNRVEYASSNSDAIVCLLAYIFEDYRDLTDEQIAIAKSIEKVDPFVDINKKLNSIRRNSEDIGEDVKLLNVITTFLLLRAIGKDGRRFEDIKEVDSLLTKDIEDTILRLQPSINDYIYRLNRRKNSDINFSKK